MDQKICLKCGAVNFPKTKTGGSFLVELALWIFFIVPGLIYSLWRLSSKKAACSTCGSIDIVPVDTPMGKKMLAESGKTLDDIKAEIPKRISPNLFNPMA